MTAFRCIETVTTLRCGRETRPPVDGMETRCGEERVFPGQSVADALWTLVQAGWKHSAAWVYCPAHHLPIRFDEQEAA